MVYLDQLDPKPVKKELSLIEMNYKDFCGSQEFHNLSATTQTTNNNTNANNKTPRPIVRSKSAHLKNELQQHFSLTSSDPSAISASSGSSSSSSSLQMNENSNTSHHNQNNPTIVANGSSGTTSNGATTMTNANIVKDSQSTPIVQEMYNFYSSSLISDYRLTLTDLIELNLIDISNGLIINPLNGTRLTIADAIRIDLLNSDVKEIANTTLFYDLDQHPPPGSPLGTLYFYIYLSMTNLSSDSDRQKMSMRKSLI